MECVSDGGDPVVHVAIMRLPPASEREGEGEKVEFNEACARAPSGTRLRSAACVTTPSYPEETRSNRSCRHPVGDKPPRITHRHGGHGVIFDGIKVEKKPCCTKDFSPHVTSPAKVERKSRQGSLSSQFSSTFHRPEKSLTPMSNFS